MAEPGTGAAMVVETGLVVVEAAVVEALAKPKLGKISVGSEVSSGRLS